MMFRNSGAMSPDDVQKANADAAVNSNTQHAHVAVTMQDHLARAESYHSSHKKQFAALTMESHQLSEKIHRVDQTLSQLMSQQASAKRHSDALPPFDRQSHSAMQVELAELSGGIASLTEIRRELVQTLEDVRSVSAAVSEEMGFLETLVSRDRYISTANAMPRPTENWINVVHSSQALCIKADPPVPNFSPRTAAAGLPNIFDKSSTVTPSRVSHQSTTARSKPTTPQTSNSSGRLHGLNWPSVTAQTFTRSSLIIKASVALCTKAEQSVQHILNKCQAQRTQVVKDQSHAIDVKTLQRQKILSDLDSIEAQMYDVHKLWKHTGDTVKQMKEPLKASSAKHEIRETVSDPVGQALVGEQATLSKTRHELKKVCRDLSHQAEDLEGQRKSKLQELETLDKQLKTDREHCNLENPAGILSRQHPIRVASIRTFPHLLATREIFGAHSTSASPANSPRRGGGFELSSPRVLTPRAPGIPAPPSAK
eukprot:CAMPEP_0176444236 /NCGR_PEP_ID=MMETSP0127-20121128/22936_1 /TAXON_ID=938130 /ORGANISM="Platyophrya macrostoma, Strain WH" /LENGTH=482 /DNA_ID=CAMNT_0017829693 /DNA_START=93 /DNA_END=1542 /DNA_ORIENTATION=+